MSYSNESHPVVNGLLSQVPDNDPEETSEWVESLSGLINEKGGPRARYILLHMLDKARREGVSLPAEYTTPYVNTIPVEQEPYFPGDEAMERQYRRWIRWNAAVQVTRAQRPGVKVGGHISSYASVATLYEVGLNHFFRGKDHPGGGDHVFFQGHASPGPYARAFLEGRLSEAEMDGFRQQASSEHGLPSYPHPRQLPNFWEYPTVSLGLGPAEAIYQAWFDRYLHLRGIKDTSQQHTWAFIGDGEMDEPESRGMLQLAAQQGLDNLTFVINCNLQRLDGPVRGNGKIIQELEAFFKGAGWNVIKVIWGRGWDQLLASDKDDALVNVMNETLDGDYQTFKANDGAYVREHFFGRDPRTKAMVQNWTDEQIWALQRGGHDYRKVYAAYKAAMEHTGQPTVILAHTIKGYILGSHFAGRNATHQMKKLTLEDAKQLRDRLQIPISDAELERDPYMPPYYKPADDDPALLYMKERREKLGGWVPERRNERNPKLPPLPTRPFEGLSKGSGSLEVATTMALVRLLKDLFKDKQLGRYFVPIIPDEARTFGMEGMFRQLGIYAPEGQKYVPVDKDQVMYYKEDASGQILQEGINEAGAFCSWIAAATSYSTSNVIMLPFFAYYSMFGFQRVGDLAWAAGDMQARGFLIGGTAGRTTLNGEGLQHEDGHSHIMSLTIPNCVSYDPSFAHEVGVILHEGLVRMVERQENVYYYVTVMNENYAHPGLRKGDEEGIIRGMYLLHEGAPAADGTKAAKVDAKAPRVQLMGSGVILREVIEAARLLKEDWGIESDIWSTTSFTELRRDGMACDRWNLLHPTEKPHVPYVREQLDRRPAGPVIASTDYMKLFADQIRPYIPADRRFKVLGTDGFGRSDFRYKLREHFEINRHFVVLAALTALAEDGVIPLTKAAEAIQRYGIDPEKIDPVLA